MGKRVFKKIFGIALKEAVDFVVGGSVSITDNEHEVGGASVAMPALLEAIAALNGRHWMHVSPRVAAACLQACTGKRYSGE